MAPIFNHLCLTKSLSKWILCIRIGGAPCLLSRKAPENLEVPWPGHLLKVPPLDTRTLLLFWKRSQPSRELFLTLSKLPCASRDTFSPVHIGVSPHRLGTNCLYSKQPIMPTGYHRQAACNAEDSPPTEKSVPRSARIPNIPPEVYERKQTMCNYLSLSPTPFHI